MLPSCFSLLSEGVTYSSRWPKGLAFSRGGKGGGVRGKENIGFCNSCLCSFYDSFLLSYYSLCLWLIAFFLCFRWRENLLWFSAWISQKLKKKYIEDGGGNRAFLPACSYFSVFLPLFLTLTSLALSFTLNNFQLMIVEIQITVLLQITSSRFSYSPHFKLMDFYTSVFSRSLSIF